MLRSRLPRLAFLTVVGPGLISGFADNDAGGITTCSVVGTQFGYDLMCRALCRCGRAHQSVQSAGTRDRWARRVLVGQPVSPAPHSVLSAGARSSSSAQSGLQLAAISSLRAAPSACSCGDIRLHGGLGQGDPARLFEGDGWPNRSELATLALIAWFARSSSGGRLNCSRCPPGPAGCG